MKVLKISLILLISTISFVSCKKSEIKPTGNNISQSTVSNTNNTGSSESNEFSRPLSDGSGSVDTSGGGVVGSGDDDRDGGEKKKKR